MDKMREEFETWFRKKLGLGADAQFHRDDQVYLNRWETWQAARSAPAGSGEAVATKFFAYEPDNGFETFNTAAQAKNAAQDSIDCYREDAADGWPDEVENVYWGVVLGTTKQVPVPDDSYDGSQGVADSGPYVDYVLTDNTRPAPDALAEAMKDAARYRYIRRKDAWKNHDLHSPGSVGAVFVAGDDGCGYALDESDLDASVDAALAAAGKE